MLKLPNINSQLTLQQEREAKIQVGKFRARYNKKKKPTKNGYFVTGLFLPRAALSQMRNNRQQMDML